MQPKSETHAAKFFVRELHNEVATRVLRARTVRTYASSLAPRTPNIIYYYEILLRRVSPTAAQPQMPTPCAIPELRIFALARISLHTTAPTAGPQTQVSQRVTDGRRSAQRASFLPVQLSEAFRVNEMLLAFALPDAASGFITQCSQANDTLLIRIRHGCVNLRDA